MFNNSESLTGSSTKSAAFKRKSSSPRRHIPKSVTKDPSRSTPSQVSATGQSPASSSKTNAYEKQSSLTASGNDSESTLSFSTASNRAQSPLVASVKATNDKHTPVAKGASSLHGSSEDLSAANRPQSSGASTMVTSEEPTNTSKKTHLPTVPKVSDRAKRGKSVTLASKISSLVSEKESSVHPITQSRGRKRPRAHDTIVDHTPKLVPPQKPQRRRYSTGEEIVIDSRPMQLPANCNFLPLEVETKEQGQSSLVSVQVEESLGQQLNHISAQTNSSFFGGSLYQSVDSSLAVVTQHSSGNPAKCFVSEGSVGVSGTASHTDAEVDKGAAILPNLETPELFQPSLVKEEPKSPSANEGSQAEFPFIKCDDTSSIITSQESTESFYTAPAYTPTKTQSPVVRQRKASDHEQTSIEFESTVRQPHITNLPSSHVDFKKKADNQSRVDSTGLISIPPSDEAMEVSFNAGEPEPHERLAPGSLVPTAMKHGSSTEESSSCFSPSLTTPTEHTMLDIMPMVPCLVATASPDADCPQTSTHGSLVPVSNTSTTTLQVELTLALVVCQPPLSTLASTSTGTVVTSNSNVPTMSTNVDLVPSTECSGQDATNHNTEREQLAACIPEASTISHLSSPLSSSVYYVEMTETSEPISPLNLKEGNHTSTQPVDQGSGTTESTIKALEQKVYEAAVSTFVEAKGTLSSALIGSPPVSVSMTGKYNPTHPAWPDSPLYTVSFVCYLFFRLRNGSSMLHWRG